LTAGYSFENLKGLNPLNRNKPVSVVSKEKCGLSTFMKRDDSRNQFGANSAGVRTSLPLSSS
jgi:hypothetical protein